MKLSFGQKAAAWAVVQVLFAGCGGSSSAPASPPPPAPAPAPVSPTISAQPSDTDVLTGAAAAFSVTATGTSVSYQWKKNGTAIDGATSSSYQAPAATWQDDGAQYTVVVSNSAGSVTSDAATEHLQLSADQQTLESFALPPSSGVYEASWELNYTGTQSSASDYLVYDYSVYAASPLTQGPQRIAQHAPVNLATTLPIPGGGVTRVLKSGAVLVVPDDQGTYNVSYVGSGVQVDYLATDDTTVAYSQTRTNYSVVPMTGLLHAAPSEFANAYNAVFLNPGVLNTTTSWATGAAYMKYTATSQGDRYDVFDCPANTTTTGNAPAPCSSGTTLAAAMSAGETSISDGVTYHTADGTTSTVGGVSIWVATQPRQASAVNGFTVEYRIYFELNGNVYTGCLIKDGTVESSSRYRTVVTDPSTTVYLNYQVRMNSAATQSLAAGSQL